MTVIKHINYKRFLTSSLSNFQLLTRLFFVSRADLKAFDFTPPSIMIT